MNSAAIREIFTRMYGAQQLVDEIRYASELAEKGYVVIAPDALAFEERNWSNPQGYAEYFELATRLVQGKTLLSKCLHDISIALDY